MHRDVTGLWKTDPVGGATDDLTTHVRGRLYGRSVLDGVFRAAPDEDLFIGELLVAVD